jgi:hypothetical protein
MITERRTTVKPTDVTLAESGKNRCKKEMLMRASAPHPNFAIEFWDSRAARA